MTGDGCERWSLAKEKKKQKKRRSQECPTEDPMWETDWTKLASPSTCEGSTQSGSAPLEIFDMSDRNTWVMQLVRRKERALRQGNQKLAQKIEKEITGAAHGAWDMDVAGELLRHRSSGELGDSGWKALGSRAPLYQLVKSQTSVGFHEVSVRDGGAVHHRQQPTVESLLVRVIGETGTPACGLIEEARLWRQRTVLNIGEDGWEQLVVEPKITASTFVLIGGSFEDISSDRVPSFASVTGRELTALMPEARTTLLAEEFCGRWPALLQEVTQRSAVFPCTQGPGDHKTLSSGGTCFNDSSHKHATINSARGGRKDLRDLLARSILTSGATNEAVDILRDMQQCCSGTPVLSAFA